MHFLPCLIVSSIKLEDVKSKALGKQFSMAHSLQNHLRILPLGCTYCRLQLKSITSIPWHLAVFDEAHKLKNKSSSTYRAASALHGITRRLYGLTGTIMQVPFLAAPEQALPSAT